MKERDPACEDMMSQSVLLLVCWGSSILAVTSCFRVDNSSCVSAYWNTVECVLNITGPSSNYSLRFIKKTTDVSCPLVAMNQTYGCICKVESGSFSFSYKYDIHICNISACQRLRTDFFPADNIQLTPPYDIQIQEAADNFSITWKSGYEKHLYLKDKLNYQVSLQISKDVRNVVHIVKSTNYTIRRSQLTGGNLRCVKVRSSPSSSSYAWMWSKWSPETCRYNQTEEEKGREEQDYIDNIVILTKCLGPVCAAVGVLMLVLYNPAIRMKIKMLSHTPSPAPYFHSLFQQHEGNLQEWLSPGGRCVLTYKADELLTTSAVTFCDKAVAKEPRESQELLQPAGTQLQFTRCQSYVCSPAPQEVAPPPPATVCPGDMPYTRLPCSVWGVVERVPEEENKVISPPPKVFLNISQEDSGCSFEDSTQSLECSLPSSPAEDRGPPLCPCSDYCILNKTAMGFDPVLVSKVTSLNTPSDSLQNYKS